MMYEEIMDPNRENSSVQALFKPASWQTKINFINHLVLFNNVLIAILAEKAGGKTAFVQLLQENLDSQIKPCVIRVKTPHDPIAFMDTITNSLHLKNEDSHSLTLNSMITQINERKASVLLIIDDAQNLPEAWIREALREIQQQKRQHYFHLCLISDFSAVAAYNSMAKEDTRNIIHSIELSTLNENETKTYIVHKASLNNKIYTEEQLNHLYKMTGGCMAKINSYLATNSAPVKDIRQDYAGYIRRSRIAAAISVLGIGIAWFSWTNYSKPMLSAPLEIAAKAQELTPVLVSEIPFWQEGHREFVYQALPKQQILAVLDENELNDQAIYLESKVVEIPQINITKAIHISDNTIPSSLTPIKKIIAPIQNKQLGGDYTIQVLASHQIIDIHKFIRQHGLEGKCSIRKVIKENDSWYILTMGEYKTSEQANRDLQNLSGKLSHVKPWIRLTANLKAVG